MTPELKNELSHRGKGTSCDEEDTGRKVQRGRTMKILIVSDTHAKHGNLDHVLEQAGPIDMFIHLGDVEGMKSIWMQ